MIQETTETQASGPRTESLKTMHSCAKCGRSCSAKFPTCLWCYIEAEKEASFNAGYLQGLRDARERQEREKMEGGRHA